MSFAQSVVISCTGIGSRFGQDQTKALVEIMGKSIIGWQMQIFSDVKDLRVVIGFQAMEVVKEVKKYRNDVIFVYNHDYFTTKTGISYLLGAKHANDLVVEWDGGLLVHPDDGKQLLAMEEEYVAFTDITSDEPVYIDIDSNNNVISFSVDQGDYEWTGPCCLHKSQLKQQGSDVYHLIEPFLPLQGVKVRAQNIATYNDFKCAENFIKSW